MILAIDTSLGTSVAVVGDAVVFAEDSSDQRGHAEHLGPMLERALDGRRDSISLVVAGMGPGPFTGLRVGIAAARAAAMGLGVPFRGVVSHLGVTDQRAQVTTDVRRRERAWSVVDGFRVIEGPLFAPADAVPPRDVQRIDADRIDAGLLALAAVGGADEIDRAIYLREADAVPAATRKRVTQPGGHGPEHGRAS